MERDTVAIFKALGDESRLAIVRMLLEGEMPSPINPPAGCRFCTRCPYATEICSSVEPEMKDYGNGRLCACHHPLNV